MMQHFRSTLALFATALALNACATLSYISVDLSDGTVETVTSPTVSDTSWRTGSKMLFVQDDTLSDTSYYIGVFEVSEAQAYALGWSNSSNTNGDAFGGFSTSRTIPSNLPTLSFPTLSQITAYAGETPATTLKSSTNVLGGPLSTSCYSLSQWYARALGTASHGAYDLWGNVAEYILSDDGTTPYYFGGCANRQISWTNLTGGLYVTLELSGTVYNGTSGYRGARLVYTPPQSYTLSCTLDGTEVSTSTVAAYTTNVAVPTPPDVDSTWLEEDYTVTPEGLTITDGTFTMPAEDVTFAYTTKTFTLTCIVDEEPYSTQTGIKVGTKVSLPAHGIDTTTYDVDYTISPIVTVTDGTFTMPLSDVTVTYTSTKNTYTVTCIVDGETKSTDSRKVGSTVDVPTGGVDTTLYRLTRTALEPSDLTITEDNTFTMPSADVTFTYTSAAFITIAVEGGSTSNAQPIAGESVTLTANASNAAKTFLSWTQTGEGASLTNTSGDLNSASYTFTVSEIATPGSKLTFTANFSEAVQVLVYGGTVTLYSGSSSGAGYYAAGSELTIAANPPSGYTFTGWTASNGGSYTASPFTYTVPDSGSITFTAQYETEAEKVTGETTIGDSTQTEGEHAATFGYLAGTTTQTEDSYGNIFNYYPVEAPEGDYVLFNLSTNAYASVSTEAYAYTSAITVSDVQGDLLAMKRTTPSSGSAYYMGIMETTKGHFTTLYTKANGSAYSNTYETSLYSALSNEQPLLGFRSAGPKDWWSAFQKAFTKTFSLTPSLPTTTQISTAAGQGGNLDKAITSAMVNCSRSNNTGDTVSVLEAASDMEVDPYGFYNMWGNAWEMVSNSGTLSVVGGYYGSNGLGYCNINRTSTSLENTPKGFRPVLEVPELFMVTVEGAAGTATYEVVDGQEITLAPQVKTGAKFQYWTADGSQISGSSSSASVTYTVTADVTLVPVFQDTASASVSITYENCTGPATMVPGQSTLLYPASASQTLTEVTIEPASAGEWDADSQTLTLTSSASGSITVTATSKSGYLLRLR